MCTKNNTYVCLYIRKYLSYYEYIYRPITSCQAPELDLFFFLSVLDLFLDLDRDFFCFLFLCASSEPNIFCFSLSMNVFDLSLI